MKSTRNCRDAINLLTEYLEDALTPGEARRLEAHLADCSACAEFLENLRKARAAIGALRAQAVPGPCRRELRDFLRKEIKKERNKRGSGRRLGA